MSIEKGLSKELAPAEQHVYRKEIANSLLAPAEQHVYRILVANRLHSSGVLCKKHSL